MNNFENNNTEDTKNTMDTDSSETQYLETHFTIDNYSYTSVSRRNSNNNKFTKQRERAARSLDKY